MIFSKLKLYKVVEFDSGLCIIDQHDNLTQRPSMVPLMIGPSDTVAEYLARYMHARESGKEIVDAHKAALEGAKILEYGPLLDPKAGRA